MVLLATEASAADRVTQVPLRALLSQVSGRLMGTEAVVEQGAVDASSQNQEPFRASIHKFSKIQKSLSQHPATPEYGVFSGTAIVGFFLPPWTHPVSDRAASELHQVRPLWMSCLASGSVLRSCSAAPSYS